MSDDNIRDIGLARFHKVDDPGAHDAVTALDAAREWIDTLDHKPDHIIVIVGRTFPDGANGTRFFQAGNFRYHAQQGLCLEGANMIRESG